MGGRQTIGDTACAVLAELAPDELDYLPVFGDVIFGGGSAARQAMRAALAGDQRSGPTGFGADTVGSIVAFVLTILNGVACNVLSGEVTEGAGWLRTKWRARRQWRAIEASSAPAGLKTELPTLSAVQSARVGRRVLELALSAGVSEEQAQRISTLISAALLESDVRGPGTGGCRRADRCHARPGRPSGGDHVAFRLADADYGCKRAGPERLPA